MFEAFLVTTSTEGLSARGSSHQRQHALVADAVRDALGDTHANIFAEYENTDHGDRYDWYAPVAGKARKLGELDEARQAEARGILDGIVADIRGHAEHLGEASDPEQQRLGEALMNALEIPSEDAIHVVETADGTLQPVLVNWAWTSDAQKAVRGILTGTDTRAATVAKAAALATPAAAPVAAAPAPARRFSAWWLLWLGWLLLALMIAAILYLLIAPCGLRGPAFLSNCLGPEPVASAAHARTLELEDQIAQLERQIAIADRACQPAPPPPPPPPEPTPAPPPPEPEPQQETEIDRRLNRAGAQRGELAFSLAWNSRADLDLHVTCPTGNRIFWNARSGCSGTLDVDANARQTRSDPVENTYYANPPRGGYKVTVNLYTLHSARGPQRFQLQIREGGQVRTINGTVSPGQKNWTYTHQYRGRP